MTAPVVVTGLGALAPNGAGTEEFWAATLSGRNGIGPISTFDASGYPSRLVGRIEEFDAAAHIPNRLLPQTDRVTRLALAATDWALADAGVDPAALPEYDMGVITSNACGGVEFTHVEIEKLWTVGPSHVSVYESFAWFYAVNTGQISIAHGMRGPGGVLVAEQAGGLDAVGHARRQVRRGTRLVVSGGLDSALDPWGVVAHISGGLVSTVSDPRRAFLPFDRAAAGGVPGEGGAILILEDLASARDRDNGPIYGEVAGYAATFDPAPDSGRPPGLRRAVTLALADARVDPSDVDVVFADSAGVPELDRIEADAIASVFGPAGVAVTAPKSMTGRLSAGGGPLDLAAALLSIRDGVVPPTVNVSDVPADYHLDLVGEQPRDVNVRTALVLARGAGGFNTAIVLRAMP